MVRYFRCQPSEERGQIHGLVDALQYPGNSSSLMGAAKIHVFIQSLLDVAQEHPLLASA